MTVIAVIKDPEIAQKILKAMGLPWEAPTAARAPPRQEPVEFVQDSMPNFPMSEDDLDAA